MFRSSFQSLCVRFLRTLCATLLCLGTVRAVAQPIQDPRALWEQATIYRDEWGVPHIQADNFYAMAFAFGYAQADDHIEAMLKAYRVASGRAAEVYGEAYADSDEFALKLGHLEAARASFPYADPITADLCSGFALGVNTWLVDHPGDAPEWADGVRPEEILALIHCYLMSFAPFDLPNVWGRAPAATTGNAWALAPSRTTTGETMIAINPHTDYGGPFQWYEAQLTVGDFNMAGATLFGIPTIMMGHNGVLGWALTPNFNDFADVYLEPGSSGDVDPKNPASVFANRDSMRYLQMVANSRTYYVRQPGGMEERQVPYLDTKRGPIVGKEKGRFASYHIGGYRDFGALRQFHLMAAAQNLKQFQNALDLHQLPCFHIVYADREGNIFYLYNTKVGNKYWPGPADLAVPANSGEKDAEPNTSPRTVDWSLPVPGGSSTFEWGPIIPPSALPSLTNPAAGYIQACGTPPWDASERTDLKAADWPGWFARDVDSFRAQRARRLLALGQRSFNDVQAMLYDVLVPAAMYAVPWLKQTADTHRDWVLNAHPDLAPCIDGIHGWNYVAEPDSPGMTYFHVWWTTLHQMTGIYNDVELVKTLGANSDEIQKTGLRAAEEAAMLLRGEFQTLNVPWGDVHTFVRGETTMPAPGGMSGQPLFVASDDVYTDHTWQVGYGYGFGMVVAFGPERTRAVSMVPFGASEDPESPHFADQMQLLRDRRLKFTHFDPSEVRRLAESGFGSQVRVSPPGMEAECTITARDPVKVTTKMFSESPAPLPPDLATFTVYARLAQDPVTVPSSVDMTIHVGPELCAPEHLPYLAVYAYDSTNGWTPLQAQEVNAQAQTFTCRDRELRTYAVLGPADYRRAPDVAKRVRVAETIPDEPAEPLMPAVPKAVDPEPQLPFAPLVPSRSPAVMEPSREPVPVQSPPPLIAAAAQADTKTRQGAITWGSNLRLQPPQVDGLVEMRSEAPFGARLIAFEEPPAPLPGGMAAFTEFVAADCQSPSKPVDLTVHLRVQQDVCAPETVENLSLYALNDHRQWEPLADQKCDAAKRQFTAKDSMPRIYAVLGPQAQRLKSPGPMSSPASQRPQ